MSRRTHLALGAAGVVAGLALGVTGFAGAASPSPSPQPTHPFRHHLMEGLRGHHGYGGLVSAVSGSTLTLRTPRGTEKVTLTSSTQYFRGRTAATKAAVQAGEVVLVRLVDPRASAPVAAAVVVLPAHLAGFITAIGSDTLTITDLSGFTRTIKTSGSTTYVKDGATSTRSALTVGTLVRAHGTVDADGTTLDATRVATGWGDRHELPDPADLPGPDDAGAGPMDMPNA